MIAPRTRSFILCADTADDGDGSKYSQDCVDGTEKERMCIVKLNSLRK
jgi:hypothetical protein